MRRKLVKHGEATMMLSLPAKWLKKFNLGKGDELELEERDSGIFITTGNTLSNKNKVVIDVNDIFPNVLINRVMIALYERGVDELEIKFEKYSQIKDFNNRVMNELIGFEVIKQTPNSILIKDIAKPEKQDQKEFIQRLFLILDSMIKDLIESLENNKPLDTVIETDVAVNKFAHFCQRLLNKYGYSEFNKTAQVYGMVAELEKLGDILKRTSREIISKKIKVSKKEIGLLKELNMFLELFRKLFFSFNREDSVKFAKKYEEIKSKIEQKGIGLYLFDMNETIVYMNNYLLVMCL